MAGFHAALHVDLEVTAFGQEGAYEGPVLLERGDERADHDVSGFEKELCRLADSPYVFAPVRVGEPEIATEPVPDVIPVEEHGLEARPKELSLQRLGYRRLAGT
jgi:hypothetical protein